MVLDTCPPESTLNEKFRLESVDRDHTKSPCVRTSIRETAKQNRDEDSQGNQKRLVLVFISVARGIPAL